MTDVPTLSDERIDELLWENFQPETAMEREQLHRFARAILAERPAVSPDGIDTSLMTEEGRARWNAAPPAVSPEPSEPKTELGRKLMEGRAAYIADGGKLSTADEISAELGRGSQVLEQESAPDRDGEGYRLMVLADAYANAKAERGTVGAMRARGILLDACRAALAPKGEQ